MKYKEHKHTLTKHRKQKKSISANKNKKTMNYKSKSFKIFNRMLKNEIIECNNSKNDTFNLNKNTINNKIQKLSSNNVKSSNLNVHKNTNINYYNKNFIYRKTLYFLIITLGFISIYNSAAIAKTSSWILKGQVNLNNATIKQLILLPQIGKSKARAIIKYRNKHKFRKTKEIIKIKGIGWKTYKKLKPFLKTKGESNLRKIKQGHKNKKLRREGRVFHDNIKSDKK